MTACILSKKFKKIPRSFDDETQTITSTLYPNGNENNPIVTQFKYNSLGELIELRLPNNDTAQREYENNTEHHLYFEYDNNGNNIKRTSNNDFIYIQKYNEMDLPIQQRAGRNLNTFLIKQNYKPLGLKALLLQELTVIINIT